MYENTEEAREALAHTVVEGMDMDDLIEFAESCLISRYEQDDSAFQDDCTITYE